MSKNQLLFILFVALCNCFIQAQYRPIVIQHGGSIGDHSEYVIPADMPEVYYDSEAHEIILVADGYADYYDVDIISQSTQLAVISTQIDGYGDTIDVSSLPDDDYIILITSSNNNEFEGYFSNY